MQARGQLSAERSRPGHLDDRKGLERVGLRFEREVRIDAAIVESERPFGRGNVAPKRFDFSGAHGDGTLSLAGASHGVVTS